MLCSSGERKMISGFYPTYEELKYQSFAQIHKQIKVFTLPMRNWNFHTSFFMGTAQHVFTLPMRNWNLCWIFAEFLTARGFYPTYEELKLLPQISYYALSSWVFTLPMRNWNIAKRDVVWCDSAVFTLPMRNWNLSLSKEEISATSSFYPTYEELKYRWVTLLCL